MSRLLHRIMFLVTRAGSRGLTGDGPFVGERMKAALQKQPLAVSGRHRERFPAMSGDNGRPKPASCQTTMPVRARCMDVHRDSSSNLLTTRRGRIKAWMLAPVDYPLNILRLISNDHSG